jgi:hypothetical protein
MLRGFKSLLLSNKLLTTFALLPFRFDLIIENNLHRVEKTGEGEEDNFQKKQQTR